MKKNLLIAQVLVLVFSLLVACGGGTPMSSTMPAEVSESPATVPIVEPTTEQSTTGTVTVPPATPNTELPTEPPKVGKWAPSRDTGSAKSLTGNCVVFMIFFLPDAESTVHDATREDYLRYMKEADDFLTAQAAVCGQTLKLLYGEDDLMRVYTSPTLLSSEIGFAGEMFWEAGMGNDFEATAARYDADNIAYVLCLNKRGDFCYANPQNEYMPSNVNETPEVCVMYTYSLASDGTRYPMASASVLTHEILHLFGAADLYPGSGRTDEANELLNSVYLLDLMRYGTGDLSEKTLCEVDQYLVGWIPSLADDLWQFIDYVEP